MRTTLLAGLLVLTYRGIRPRPDRVGAARAPQRGRVRRHVPAGQELGTVGPGRSARIGEPHHAGQTETGDRPRQDRRDGVAGAHAAHREGRRQQQPVRAHDAARQQHGSLRHPVSRLRAQPHRRALPHPLQGADLQRLRARRRQHRQGLHQARHPEPQGRHRHARRAGRHPAAAQPAVSRTGHRDLCRRSRGMGEEVRREDRAGRRAAAPHRTLGAAREARALERGTERGGAARVGRTLDQGARRLASSAAMRRKTSRRRWWKASRCRSTR